MPHSGFRTADSEKNLKKFGLSVGTALIFIAGFLLYHHKLGLGGVILAVGGLLILLGLVQPLVLRPVFAAWMKLALVLAFVNTRIILGFVFFFIFSPVGLLLRLFQVDMLERSRNAHRDSYWKTRAARVNNYLDPF